VSQLESTLAKERSERAELLQRIEQLEAHDEARIQRFAEQEKVLSVQVGVKKNKGVYVLYSSTSLMPVLYSNG